MRDPGTGAAGSARGGAPPPTAPGAAADAGGRDAAGGGLPSVLHVLDTEEYAGRESVVEKLAAGQRRAGCDARVACVVEEGTGDPPFLASASASGIPLEVLRLPPRAYLREWRRLVELCRERRTDVLHTHGYRPDFVGGLAAARAGVASVSTVHGFIRGGWKNRLYLRLQRLALRRFDAVVAVSEGVAGALRDHGVDADRVHLIRNAWGGRDDFLGREEARRELSADEDAFLVGWVGRVSREKGLDVLLDALREPSFPEAAVSVIGDGPERASLARASRDGPGGPEVRWHGSVEAAYRYFRAFDVFVLSSRTEGTPMVLLEAMAAGVPVVAARVGGVPDVVTGDEALLVPPEDTGALASAVARVRRRPEEAAARARAARRRLEEEFGPEGWVARYVDVYREVARPGEGGGGG